MKNHSGIWMAGLTLAAISCGCGPAVKTTTVVPASAKLVVKDATREELIAKYNATARSVQSLNATVELKPTAGSQYSGVIEEYHEVKAFLLAKRPAQIRVIGQAPVIGKTIFDMTSDGQTFRVFIPSKRKFLTGPVAAERQSKKPIENLRPQHLLDALLWAEIPKDETVLFEEFNDERGRYYVLTVLHAGALEALPEITRKIWYERANLSISRLQYFAPGGALVSDVILGDWQAVTQENAVGGLAFPRSIRIERAHDDYQLNLQFTKIQLNEELPADRFTLDQPEGTELVRVGEEAGDQRP